jgi:pimeloyl-ACP methyl ester carboxylesterase
MSTFVIVHGAFGGGWEWSDCASILREMGHRVFTPTLSGFGERHHLGPKISLSTCIRDITALLEFEDLTDVVLCGASYGGVVATAAADEKPERVRLLIYIDALMPRDGQCGLDLLPDGFGKVVREAAFPDGSGWVEMPAGLITTIGDVPEARRRHFAARYRPQPVATFTDPVHLSGAVDELPRVFIRCTGGGLSAVGDPIAAMAERARAERWIYRELHAPHDPHAFDSRATAEMLDEVASAT